MQPIISLKRDEHGWSPLLRPSRRPAAFFLLAGDGYLRMLKLFARGIANFVVEPNPYILVFLFALVWLVPLTLARFFRGHARSASARRAVRLLGRNAARCFRKG